MAGTRWHKGGRHFRSRYAVAFKFDVNTESRDKHNIGFREFAQRFCDRVVGSGTSDADYGDYGEGSEDQPAQQCRRQQKELFSQWCGSSPHESAFPRGEHIGRIEKGRIEKDTG